MAKFLMELCLPEYSMLEYVPSQIAASALYLSLKLHKAGEWVGGTCTLKSVHIHDDLKLGCDDFICTIVYSLIVNIIRLIHDYTVTQ